MKISRASSNKHDMAMAMVNLDRKLTEEEVEFVLQNYNPMATHNVTKNAIFFTPFDLAWELAVHAAPSGDVIDLCAGIGVLTYQVLLHDRAGGGGQITRMVALEQDEEFVMIGRKLMPDVEWVQGSVFDLDLLSSLGYFDVAISNPPFGSVDKAEGSWLSFRGPAHMMVAEVACRMAYSGGMFIMPSIDCEYNLKRRQHVSSTNVLRFKKKVGDVSIYPIDLDYEYYKGMWQGASPDVAIIDITPEKPMRLPERQMA